MATSIGSAVRSRLIADAAVTALVGTRIYPKKAPQSPTLPFIIYKVIADVPSDDIDGHAGLYRAVIQYMIHADTEQKCNDIEEVLRKSIQGYRGTLLGVKIQGIHHLHSMGDFEDEVIEYTQIERFSVWYKRTNPIHDD